MNSEVMVSIKVNDSWVLKTFERKCIELIVDESLHEGRWQLIAFIVGTHWIYP